MDLLYELEHSNFFEALCGIPTVAEFRASRAYRLLRYAGRSRSSGITVSQPACSGSWSGCANFLESQLPVLIFSFLNGSSPSIAIRQKFNVLRPDFLSSSRTLPSLPAMASITDDGGTMTAVAVDEKYRLILSVCLPASVGREKEREKNQDSGETLWNSSHTDALHFTTAFAVDTAARFNKLWTCCS